MGLVVESKAVHVGRRQVPADVDVVETGHEDAIVPEQIGRMEPRCRWHDDPAHPQSSGILLDLFQFPADATFFQRVFDDDHESAVVLAVLHSFGVSSVLVQNEIVTAAWNVVVADPVVGDVADERIVGDVVPVQLFFFFGAEAQVRIVVGTVYISLKEVGFCSDGRLQDRPRRGRHCCRCCGCRRCGGCVGCVGCGVVRAA